MRVVPGPANPALSKTLATALGTAPVRTETRRFPDGEIYARVLEPLAGDVVVVQSTPSNDDLLALLLLLDAARAHGAEHLVAVVPYYGYARQDRRFQPGEALSSDVVARAIDLYADAIVVVDPHKEAILDRFPGSAVACTAVPELAASLAADEVDLVLAPDAGARERAEAAAKAMGADVDHLEKKRIDAHTVEIAPKKMDAKGRTVAILDDMISTGGTMARATETLLKAGAKAVHCAATHGLFAAGAEARLAAAGVASVRVADTVPGPNATVSAAAAVQRGLGDVLHTVRAPQK